MSLAKIDDANLEIRKKPKVFDRFYRADPSRTQEIGGYGLGLSIAKSIIDRLGGEIHVTNVENECTTFTFTLGL
jgi:signal transduction histidine kinase